MAPDVQEREKQSVSHIVRIIGCGDLSLGANARKKAREGSVTSRLEEMKKMGVVRGVLGGTRHDDKGGLLLVGGDGHDCDEQGWKERR